MEHQNLDARRGAALDRLHEVRFAAALVAGGVADDARDAADDEGVGADHVVIQDGDAAGELIVRDFIVVAEDGDGSGGNPRHGVQNGRDIPRAA